MTIAYAQFLGTPTKPIATPTAIPPVVVPTPATWTRPSDWAALPTITGSDQKFAGIYAVYDNDTGYASILATTSAGNFQVDWGDGTSPVQYSSGTQADYKYVYSSIPGSPTTRGYKTVCITVTAVTGNLTGINIDRKYSNTPALTQYAGQWLDIYMGSPNFTTITIGGGTSIWPYYIERVRIVSWNITSTANLFSQCRELQVVELPSMASVTNTTNMFLQCWSLQTVPSMTLTSVTSATGMFQTCYSLVSVPDLNFHPSSNVTATELFQDCRSLQITPVLTGKFTNLANAFLQCYSLKSLSPIDTSNCSNLLNTFQSCYSLQNIPVLNTTNVTQFSGTFSGSGLVVFPNCDTSNAANMSTTFRVCYALETIPQLNMTKVTTSERMFDTCTSLDNIVLTTSGNLVTANSMFNGCNSLANLANFDTSNVTNTSVMFSGCQSLVAPPAIDTSKSTNARLMFNGCTSLMTLPTYNFGNVTNAASTFEGCTSLTTVGNLQTSKVTDFSRMFFNCFSLIEGPNIPTANGNVFTQMFSGCGSMYSIPTYDTANATSMNFMFNECQVLQSVPNISMTKNTNVNSMFNLCRSLNSVPAFNLANVTNAGTFVSTTSVGKATVTNIQANISFVSSLLPKTNLENIFDNLGTGNSTARTITITTNPGNDTVVTKSSNTTSGSNVVVIANTVGLSTNMLVTGNNISNARAVTFQDAGDTVTLTAHGISNNTIVSFSTITTTTGISVYTPYYVVNTATDTFQVSATQGGGALPLTNNGSGNLLYGTFINTINANANIIVSVPASGTATGQTLTFSILDTSKATLKNWSVSR